MAPPRAKTSAIKSLLDRIPEGIVTLDRQGTIEGANAQAAALFGRAQDGMAGHSLGEFLAPESERVAREYFERVASGAHGGNGDGNGIDVAAHAGENRLIPLALTLTADRTGALRRDVS